ncbi:MAG: thioredoxin domain-containing protein, partial [Promethearchaeota archaeon]
GLLELYEATFDVFYLDTALELNKQLIEHYWDDYIGGFFFTADDGEKLITRRKELYDGAIPSGNSVAFLNLLRLSYLTGDHELEEKADILGRVFSERISGSSLAYTQFMIGVDFAFGPSYSLVVSGDTNGEDTKEMLENIRNKYIPNKVLIHRPTESYPPEIDKYANFIEWFDKVDDKATAYVCINKTCKPPTNDINQMLEYLNAEWS